MARIQTFREESDLPRLQFIELEKGLLEMPLERPVIGELVGVPVEVKRIKTDNRIGNNGFNSVGPRHEILLPGHMNGSLIRRIGSLTLPDAGIGLLKGFMLVEGDRTPSSVLGVGPNPRYDYIDLPPQITVFLRPFLVGAVVDERRAEIAK